MKTYIFQRRIVCYRAIQALALILLVATHSVFANSEYNPNVVNVTEVTGQNVVGKVASWQTQNGEHTVEHLAGRNSDNDLLVFYWQPNGSDWQVVNVSQITGKKIESEVTSWQTQNGQYNVEHLAARNADNELLVFYWQPDGQDWRVVNVTEITGKTVLSPVTSWQTPNGSYNVEHLAGRGANNELLVFYWQPNGRDWQVVNVSQITGNTIADDVVSWQTTNGQYNVEHLAGRNAQNELLVFYWQSDGRDWRVVNVSDITGQSIVGSMTQWQTPNGSYNVEHLAARNSNNDLLVFYWQADGLDWRVVNASAIAGKLIGSNPSAYKNFQGEVVIGARGVNDELLQFWWTSSRDWQVMNLSTATGESIHSSPEGWAVSNRRDDAVEHFAALSCDQDLLVFWNHRKLRRLTDDVANSTAGVKRVTGERKVITILWDPSRPDHPAPSRDEVIDMMYGSYPSVQSYFSENSGGLFSLKNEGVLGWYAADRPHEYYWAPADVGDSNNDGWVRGHWAKWAEAITKASADVDFKSYDINDNGVLSSDELTIHIVIPQSTSSGNNREPFAREWPFEVDLKVDGVKIPIIVESYISSRTPSHYGVIAHELAHGVLKLGDMYPAPGLFKNFRARKFSLMDDHFSATHIDPANKLKLGWLRPRMVARSGIYTIDDIETSRSALILMNPERSTNEYFIIENRWGGESYDRLLPDEGIGIWHIIEEPEIFGNAEPPPNLTDDQLKQWHAGDDEWARRGIRLIRPLRTNPITDRQGLWSAEERDPDVLYWADGTPSDFAIDSISVPGQSMNLTITTPFDAGATLSSTHSCALNPMQMLPDNDRLEDVVAVDNSSGGGALFGILLPLVLGWLVRLSTWRHNKLYHKHLH